MLQKDYFGHFVHERSVGGKSEGRDIGISCGSPGERWKSCSHENVDKWLDLGCILEVHLIGLHDGECKV